MSADPNRLLYVISAHGEITWARYCEAVDFLSKQVSDRWQETGGAAARSHLLRSMQALGHCDVIYKDGLSIISIVPPALCRLPRAGLPIAVLTGARWLHTYQKMRETAAITNVKVQLSTSRNLGPLGLLPDTVLIETSSEEAMMMFCEKLGITYIQIPPAWTLVNWCGNLAELEQTLDFRHPATLNWPRFDFSIQALDFIRVEAHSFPRFTRYRNPTTQLPLHIFFSEDRGAEVDLLWGRYLILKSSGVSVTAYDERKFYLCVPVKVPLPSVVARAICLCSGQPPRNLQREGLIPGLNCSDWLMFDNVPPQVALAALSKVGQSPEKAEIN